jgi:hypothetical protein
MPRSERRRRARPGPRTVSRVVALGTLTGSGDHDLQAAAEIIRDGAKALSGSWSKTVPESIGLRMEGKVAIISAGAPAARPAELRLRHPLFGDRSHWYGPPGEPFLAPAADARSDAAMARYAKKVDGWCKAAGYR